MTCSTSSVTRWPAPWRSASHARSGLTVHIGSSEDEPSTELSALTIWTVVAGKRLWYSLLHRERFAPKCVECHSWF
jgi:hypothetical protein